MGLDMVAEERWAAATALTSGLGWLRNDPGYRANTSPLVQEEDIHISRLIDQIREADRKVVFQSTDPMAAVSIGRPEQVNLYPGGADLRPFPRRPPHSLAV